MLGLCCAIYYHAGLGAPRARDMFERFSGLSVSVLGYGFLGFHLAERLSAAGAHVTAMTRPGRIDAHLPPSGVRVCYGDIRCAEDVRAAIAGADAILNVCGVSGAVASNANPRHDLEVNCLGTLTVLEAVRRFEPNAHVLFAGSRLQFGVPQKLPVTEEAPQRPNSIYGMHKAAGESYHFLYGQLHGVRTTVLRLSNPYGFAPAGLTTGYNVLNNFIRLAEDDGELRVFAPGTQVRDYIHVSEVVDAFLRCALNEAAVGEAFNIGGGAGTRLIDAARTVVDVVGRGRVVEAEWPAAYQKAETGDFIFDIGKATRRLGWAPRIGLEEGVARTVDAMRLAVAS